MKRVRFLEPAIHEFEEHVAYFDEQVAGLGDRFDEEVEFASSLIAEHPQIGASVTKRIRKFRLRSFPYSIIYAVEAEEIVIIAVAPQRRRPNYWRGRSTKSR